MHHGYIDPNFPNPNGPEDATIVIYGYTPSFGANLAATILYALFLVVHFWQMIKYRYWSFSLVCLACLAETLGFALRCLSSRLDPYRISFFVGNYFLVTCAPVFISASIYVFVSNLSTWTNAHYGNEPVSLALRFTPKSLLWTFVGLDIVCTVLQITGAGLIGAKTSKQQDPAIVNRILIAGLAAQSISFILFLTVLILLVIKLSGIARRNSHAKILWRERRITCLAVIVASVLVLVRTVFRLVESAQGVFGFLSSHEHFFIALEMTPILAAVALLILKHPGRIFGRSKTMIKDRGSA
ncbi:hypothetical protein K461DRAFT_322791 [Myriangium duriaei CBS 260.36]|uniref:RTA1-domain-containing protein n=1 Tax=Myriangium duriaei CBS 260.36 TaxID=1168546 RepID=A0A9P4MET9_9PEZI|nr:hypothetical protein K461DRAFT_322791 [Myriangium duriaei CBS 260.36]